ncbi:MAG: histidine kinase [Firmicutes bacterium]|nr:histidine kinase [Bacillota bacterium]
MNSLKGFCQEYTKLSAGDIAILEKYQASLQSIADLNKADVFIDCLMKDSKKAIVVAEAKPENNSSIYYDASWLGERVSQQNEPGVFHTLWTGQDSHNTLGRAVTENKVLYNEGMIIRQSVVPIKNGEQVIACLIMEKNIEKQVEREKEYEIFKYAADMLSESFHEVVIRDGNLISHLYEGLIITNVEGKVVFVNPNAEKILAKIGTTVRPYTNIYFDELAFNIGFDEIKETKEKKIKELSLQNLVLQLKCIPITSAEEEIGFIFLIRDITEIKDKERELILKSTAIKEIHHRVKNNLQTVATLLRLQMRKHKDRELKGLLNQSINRIMSISVIYQLLCSEGNQILNLKMILKKIIDINTRGIIADEQKILTEISGQDIMLDSDKATTVALIVNELIQNSLKHAFQDQDEGFIKVKIVEDSGLVSIVVHDNGRGIQEDEISENSNLGLKIVNTLIKEKLKGNIDIKSNSGTETIIEFSNF